MITTILLTVASLFGLFLLFALLALSLARHNMFFTLVEEGKIKVILHNKAFKRAIMKYEGFYLDKRWNVVPSQRRERLTKKQAQDKGYTWDGIKRRKEDMLWYRIWTKLMGGGLVFVGIWPFDTVYIYKFRWLAPKLKEDALHDELLDYVFAKSAIYKAELEKVETKGMVPLNIVMFLTIRVTNPYRALFRTNQWLEFSTNRLLPYIRQYIPTKDIEFEKLIGETQLSDGPLFQFLKGSEFHKKFTPEEKKHMQDDGLTDKQIEDAEHKGKGILWDLKEIYGVDIQGIEFKEISTAGEVYETAAAKKWSAEREKEKITIEAEADAKKIRTIAEAEADRIKTVAKAIQDSGEAGLVAKVTDTIKDSAAKLPNLVILPSNFNLLDLFKRLGGKDEGGEKK